MKRVGVFVCHCGTNIGAVVDCAQAAEAAKAFPGVVYSADNKYMCSEPGQELIKKAIQEYKLDRIVVASCSPRMHEATFRRCVENAGLNPYFVEMANIREHCSWVHANEKEKATEKAIDLIKMAVAKAIRNKPLQRSTIPVTDRALVIGGGIAGIQAALDIANAGHIVDIVEKEPSIGGKMAQIDKTFPTLDCSACILTPKMVEAAAHPNINLITFSEIEKVEGFVGNFDVTIKKKARSVKMDVCTGCGLCMEKCPSKVDSEFELGMAKRRAIYTPFPQAIPNKPVIDRANCTYFKSGKCGLCAKVCAAGAIDYTQQEELETRRYGAIVVATGFELFDQSAYGEYGYGKYPDVISGMQFERLINASGPTLGKIKRPSDHQEPKNVVFIKCVGSRDEAKGKSYCSKACCMYSAKHATLVSEKIKDANVYVFYMDVRAGGKGYEEFYNRTREQYRANYIRGRVSKIYQQGDKLIVRGEDTLISRPVEIEADMVVLATAMIAQPDASKLAQKIGIGYDKDDFYTEAHPKLAPVETHTQGVYLAGACQGPKDIPESVAQGSAAAAKVCGLLSKSEMPTEPIVSEVEERICSGCELCAPVCPYKAIEMKIISERCHGKMVERKVAAVNSSLCQGCGACTVACRSAALNLKHFTDEQILAEVNALCL
ncbi:fumarate reductase/succinate dehydrogenase flavoprotein domain protein [Syntrophobotulus glycolicus DSM 8271]|uniref:Fumarate reductase/succinate dehydrogenase flavoprotein domain protein n=1 Tax=Syntrophobotulus glycolicus (strain DSM 8271 / FlGlyR) TaxID=645991 RepID=F0T0Q7_SYNGF|nr:CoB--CoM heterodisulfide reductase iron-sulfur subunit A family protein [Syntrophobotulus glycolicus]ADY56196.1 fumarate reductase/succinate dehydrogenase flavoprotein domain protein [Syntrophobotulus glycolicus DSM 8271]